MYNKWTLNWWIVTIYIIDKNEMELERNMKTEINLREQLDLCGDEYLDEKNVPAIFQDYSTTYISMEIEGRMFLIKKDEFRKLAMIVGDE
jgi:hypothetical protein